MITEEELEQRINIMIDDDSKWMKQSTERIKKAILGLEIENNIKAVGQVENLSRNGKGES